MAIMLVARLMYVTPQTHHHPMAPVSLVIINRSANIQHCRNHYSYSLLMLLITYFYMDYKYSLIAGRNSVT